MAPPFHPLAKREAGGLAVEQLSLRAKAQPGESRARRQASFFFFFFFKVL